MKTYSHLIVNVDKLCAECDESEHAFTFQLNKNHRETLKSILRQMFDHPNTKYSKRLKKMNQVTLRGKG